MSLFKVMDIAGSAMSAQSVRLNTVASNLANADSISSSVNQTYKARKPVFATKPESRYLRLCWKMQRAPIFQL